jgi:predicted RNA-binding Zn-ribbon protein involved in translation (DUF1610 family)
LPNRKYSLYCEICGWKRIIDGSEPDLIEYKTAAIPGGMPQYDPELKKTIFKKSINQPKKFKCQNCGRVVTVRKLPVEDNDGKKNNSNGN